MSHIATIKISWPIHEEKGIKILTTEAASQMLSERGRLARAHRRALEKLLGSNSARVKAHIAHLSLHGLFDDTESECDLEDPMQLDRLTAFRTLGLLPGKLANNEGISPEQRLDIDLFYMAMSLWMIAREKGTSGLAAQTLSKLGLDMYEQFATVSELRFKMIQRLCELRILPMKNECAAWLIAEASACLLREDSHYYDGISSRESLYYARKGYIDYLASDNAHLNTEVLMTNKSAIRDFLNIVEASAKQRASVDQEFKTGKLEPYTKALTGINSRFRKLNSVRGLDKKKRPGPKLGSKYAKC